MDKISKIQNTMMQHKHYLNLPKTGDVVLSDEETIAYHQIIHDAVNHIMKEKPYFNLSELIGLVSRDKRLQQEIRNIRALNQVLNSYGIGAVDGRRLIHMGDAALDLYTTEAQFNYELSTLRFVNHKFANSVKAERSLIEQELNQPKYQTMSEEQRKGVYACTMTDSIVSSLQGYAGAGKSFTMGAVAKIYKKMGFDVQGVTLSWKAAGVLQAESQMTCYSIASLLTRLKKKKQDRQKLFNKPTVLILDEAGLIGLDKMYELLQLITENNIPVKIILSGDSTQLNPIKSPNSLELIEKVIDDEAKATIGTIRRQKTESHRNAVLSFKDGFSGQGLYTLLYQESVKLLNNTQSVQNHLIKDYFMSMTAEPNANRLILCMDNDLVNKLNSNIHQMMQYFGKVQSKDYAIPVFDNDSPASAKVIHVGVGDKIVFTTNFKNIMLKKKGTNINYKEGAFLANKLQGTITSIYGNEIDGFTIQADIPMIDEQAENGIEMTTVTFNTKQPVGDIPALTKDSTGAATYFDLNYALTIYSSQGQTVDEVYIVNSPLYDTRHIYVGMSRHKVGVKLYIDKHKVSEKLLKNNPNLKLLDLTPLDYLNQVAMTWNRRTLQNSITMKFLNEMENINQIAMKHHISVDVNQLSSTFLELKRQDNNEQQSKYKERSLIRYDGYSNLMDCADYYVHKPNPIDFKSLEQNHNVGSLASAIHNQEINDISQENKNELDIPLIEKDSFKLHPMITEDFFHQYQDKIVSIGRGSEIRITGASEYGVIFSKYDLKGNDTMHMNYPVMTHNGANSVQNNVLVFEDLNLYLDYVNKFYLQDNQEYNKPILIWGANDTDYLHIHQSLENKKITILGSDLFKLKTVIKMTHIGSGLKPNLTFTNFNREILDAWYLSKEPDQMPQYKLPVNRERYGEYCNSQYLENVRFQSNKWQNIIHHVKKGKFSRDNPYTYHSNEYSTFINSNGIIKSSFIKDFVLSKTKLSEEEYNQQILKRNKIVYRNSIHNTPELNQTKNKSLTMV